MFYLSIDWFFSDIPSCTAWFHYAQWFDVQTPPSVAAEFSASLSVDEQKKTRLWSFLLFDQQRTLKHKTEELLFEQLLIWVFGEAISLWLKT